MQCCRTVLPLGKSDKIKISQKTMNQKHRPVLLYTDASKTTSYPMVAAKGLAGYGKGEAVCRKKNG